MQLPERVGATPRRRAWARHPRRANQKARHLVWPLALATRRRPRPLRRASQLPALARVKRFLSERITLYWVEAVPNLMSCMKTKYFAAIAFAVVLGLCIAAGCTAPKTSPSAAP